MILRTPKVQGLLASAVSPSEGVFVGPSERSVHCSVASDSGNPHGTQPVEGLFALHSRLVLAIGYRVLGDLNEAEDLVQEVFFYIYRKPELFDPSKGTVRSWITQVALCRALDRKLYLSRRGFYADKSLECLDVAEHTDLEKLVEAKLNREQIERAFGDLTDMQRRTLECFYFEGLDLRDISEQLRQPLGSVRHHLYRGLRRLRKNSLLHSLTYA
jgi:RNA polymerase sigma-70 factor, ECF subfamily